MSEKLVAVVILVAVLTLCLWFAACQYQECREMGFSRFYCVKHAG